MDLLQGQATDNIYEPKSGAVVSISKPVEGLFAVSRVQSLITFG